MLAVARAVLRNTGAVTELCLQNGEVTRVEASVHVNRMAPMSDSIREPNGPEAGEYLDTHHSARTMKDEQAADCDMRHQARSRGRRGYK